MRNDTLNSKKEEKYFFTANIFDEEIIVEEPEEIIPPPPVFSEAELETARLKALQQGKQQGVHETEQSILRNVSQTLDAIAADLKNFFAAELERERLYEQDSIKLCLQVFEKLFPVYNEKCGFEEMKAAMETILKRQEGQQKIVIHVAPDIAVRIEEHLQTLKKDENGPSLMVKPDPAMPPGACKLAWEDGGAARNPEILAGEIKSMIEQALAGSVSKGHDGITATQTATVEKP